MSLAEIREMVHIRSTSKLKEVDTISGEATLPFYFCLPFQWRSTFNPIALRKAKIVYNFGLSEYNRVKERISNSSKLAFPLSIMCLCFIFFIFCILLSVFQAGKILCAKGH